MSVLEETLSFEREHAVGEFRMNGVNVWPYLRTNTAWRKLNEPAKLRRTNRVVDARDRLRRYSRFLLRDRAHHARAEAGKGEVVFVTLANRRESVDGVYWHPLVDPLAVEFERAGVSTLVCEAGQARWPRARKSMWISRDFKLMRVMGRLGPRLVEPQWFAEYAQWASGLLGRPVAWGYWEPHLRELFARSRWFENLFRQVATKAVFVDCWYSPESLAATLAAHRLGLLSIELQHGLQGAHMNGYAGWSTEYDLIPRLFWVWGQHAAEALRERNVIPFDSVIGGNAWLNAWRAQAGLPALQTEIGRARHLRGTAPLVVLVTLQQGIDLEPAYDAISKSPRNWKWLIRIHRKMRTPDFCARLQFRLKGLHPNITIDEPSDLPLYAVINAIDVHVTGFSTCALEALAFGKPTVAFNVNAHDAFGDLLSSCAMAFSDAGAGIVDAVRQFQSFEPARAIELGAAYYASEEATRSGVESILLRIKRER